MRKRVFALAMAVVMALSLAACGKAPRVKPGDLDEPESGGRGSSGRVEMVTAETLMDRMSALGDEGYMNMRMLVEADTEDDDGNAFTMSVSADAEYAGDVVHISDMIISYAMQGFSMDFSADVWSDKSSNESYMKIKMFGQDIGWMASDDSDSDGSSEMAGDAADMAGNVSKLYNDAELTLMPRKSDDDDWVVRWSLSLDELYDAMDLESIAGNSTGNGTVDCEARFAPDMSPKSLEAKTSSGTNVKVAFEFIEIGGKKKLSIPADVIAEAANNDGSAFFGGSGGDIDFGGDIDIGGSVDTGNTGGSGGSNIGGDGFIDGLAAAIKRVDSGEGSVDTYDFGDYHVLDYRTGKSGEWYADIEIRYILDDEYMSAKDYFETHKESTASWFDGAAPVDTSSDGHYVVFSEYEPGENYWDLSMLVWSGDIELRVDHYEYNGASQKQVMNRLTGLFADIGCGQWMPALLKYAG